MSSLTAPRRLVRAADPRRVPAKPGRVRSWWSGWRLALRMARRDIRRDRGRSIFIWLMIAIPMTIISASQVLLASQDLSPAEWLDLRLGSAQARLTWSGNDCTPAGYGGDGQATCEDSADQPAKPIAGWGDTLATKRAAVARLVGQPVVAMTTSDLRFGKASNSITELGLDAAGPTAGIVKVTGGRVPAAPGEVLVTPRGLAMGLPASGDFTVILEDGSKAVRTVVGAATARLDQYVELVGLPDQRGSAPGFLVTGFGQLTWQDAKELAHYGLETTSRAIFANPPFENVGGSQSLGLGGLIGGAALLEVALMVGPAFAIGAARQRRSLALAATNGATTAQLRRAALGQAWLLGPTAAAFGLLLGVGVGAAAWPMQSGDPNAHYGPFEIPFTYLAAMLALAVVTALIAALVPARGLGKLDLVGALRGSTRSAPLRRGAPVLGLVLLTLGIAATWAAGPLGKDNTAVFSGVWLAGVAVAVVGLLLTVPMLLVGLGRANTRAPLIARMAARELARQRGRATATVAAVVGATLLVGLTWTLTLSINADEERHYVPSSPYGQGDIETDNATTDALEPLEAAVRATDPALRTTRLATITNWSDGSADSKLPIMALRPGCTPDDVDLSGNETRCSSLGGSSSILTGSIGDLASLFALNTAQVDALRAGTVLVNTDRPATGESRNELVDGKLRVVYWDYSTGAGSKQRIVSVPATAVTAELISRAASPQQHGALVTTATAAKLGWVPDRWQLRVIDPRGPISEQAAARIDAAVGDPELTIRVERGYQPTPQGIAQLWLLTGTVGLLAIIAAAVATILGTAELRPFLATFAAVGADPRLSRRLAATQAGLLALVGCVLGIGLGMVTAAPLAMIYTSGQEKNAPSLVIPWLVGAIVLAGVPLVAAGIAAVATTARPVLSRRAT